MGLVTFGAISIMTPTGLVNSYGGPGGQSPLVLTSYMNVSWIPAFYRIFVTTGVSRKWNSSALSFWFDKFAAIFNYRQIV